MHILDMKKSILLFLCFFCGNVAAKVVLSPLFSDNMVLQQQCKVPFWGKAQAGSVVQIMTSWGNEKYTAKVDEKGNWKVSIQTPSAGGPYELTLDDGEILVLKNILIGEVWLCTGQSNMEMPVSGSWAHVRNHKQEVMQADYPSIRLLYLEMETAVKPCDEVHTKTSKWEVCSPQTIPNFSATAYFFGREIADTQKVPVGLLLSTFGGTDIEAWISADALKKRVDFTEMVEKVQKLRKKDDLPGKSEWANRNTVTGLYNAMIYPLIPFAIRGAIWYQGENNVERASQYRELFPLMIESWRRQWGYDFPFYYVQLANYMKRKAEPSESAWAELREAQLRTLRVANTGMAVAIDVGEAADIHPKNKQEVGHRLALLARARTYGEQLESSGPVLRSWQLVGNRIVLSFDCTFGGLHTKGDKILKGFSIAGHNHKFYWAKAEIEGDCVIVSADEVDYPLAVRYAWADNPECNLYNSAGLPASPFRTDDWSGVTQVQ